MTNIEGCTCPMHNKYNFSVCKILDKICHMLDNKEFSNSQNNYDQ